MVRRLTLFHASHSSLVLSLVNVDDIIVMAIIFPFYNLLSANFIWNFIRKIWVLYIFSWALKSFHFLKVFFSLNTRAIDILSIAAMGIAQITTNISPKRIHKLQLPIHRCYEPSRGTYRNVNIYDGNFKHIILNQCDM